MKFDSMKRVHHAQGKACAMLLLLLSLGFSSCSDFIEENLEDEDIRLLAPPNNHNTPTSTITFWWDEMEGADDYNFQIVSPRFDSIVQLIVDSIVQNDKFTISLSPGVYQWRVRGENSASASDYRTRNLTIDTTTDLSQQIVVLVSPANNSVTNEMSAFFNWNLVGNAEDYRFEIAKPDFSGGANVLSINLEADSIHYTLNDEGDYQWRVRAQNAFSNTAYTTRTLVIDTTAPAAPILNSPANQATVADTVSLTWTSAPGVVNDSLWIFADSLLTNNVLTILKTEQNHTFIGTSGLSYFWYLRSSDEAGNVGDFSTVRKFIIQ